MGDLLRHYPRRYVERGELTPLRDLREGEQVTVMASVLRLSTVPMRARKGSIVKVVITDGQDELDVSFFAPKRFMEDRYKRELTPGTRAMFAGKVGSFRGRRQLTHPETELIDEGSSADAVGGVGGQGDEDDARRKAERYAEAILPIYPASAKVADLEARQGRRRPARLDRAPGPG